MLSLGIIAFNILTHFTKNATTLTLVVLSVLIVCTLIPLIYIEESPEFMLYSRDSKKYMDLLEKYRKLNNHDHDHVHSHRESFDRFITDHYELLNKFEDPSKRNNQLHKMSKLSSYVKDIMILSLVGGFMNTTMASIVLHLNVLSFSSITKNGIILGAMGVLSNLLTFPILKRMPRRKWLFIFQLAMILSGVFLFLTYSFSPRSTDFFKISNLAVPVVIVGIIVNAMWVPYYCYVSEVFPVDVRGMANSFIQVIANLIPVCSPFLFTLAEYYDVHFLVGSCLVGLVSAPLTLFLKETHPDK